MEANQQNHPAITRRSNTLITKTYRFLSFKTGTQIVLRSCIEGAQKYFLQTAFYRTTNDKYIADQTSSTNPVEAASAVKSSAVGIQLGCNSSSFRSAEAYDDQWIIVGTIQATLPCDLETHLMSLTWPRVLALE